MSKAFQIVAIVLIAPVLGGAQCAGLCDLLAPQQAKLPPCHQQQQSADECTHHEIVAEQHAVNFMAEQLISLEPSPIDAVLISPATSPFLPAAAFPQSERGTPGLIPVLRL